MEDSHIVNLFFERSEAAITEAANKYGRYCYSISYNIPGVLLIDRQRKDISISDDSKKATFRFVEGVSENTFLAKSQLVWLSEEELFSKWNPVIFKGTVSRIRNIEIDFNQYKEYRAIAEIEVGKVYRGNIQPGDVLSVLLPCPIDTGIKVEDTDVISRIRVGTTGIFMPMEYNESSIWEQNGATLMLKDVSGYGFADGRRYVFLETDTGLIFAKDAYPSISDVTTLQEVENYVLKMIK